MNNVLTTNILFTVSVAQIGKVMSNCNATICAKPNPMKQTGIRSFVEMASKKWTNDDKHKNKH